LVLTGRVVMLCCLTHVQEKKATMYQQAATVELRNGCSVIESTQSLNGALFHHFLWFWSRTDAKDLLS
jgi:hypothetical protein